MQLSFGLHIDLFKRGINGREKKKEEEKRKKKSRAVDLFEKGGSKSRPTLDGRCCIPFVADVHADGRSGWESYTQEFSLT